MTAAAQINAPTAIAATKTVAVSDRMMGLALVSLLPAAFWTATLAMVGPIFGASPSAVTLLLTGGAIAAFLAVVVSGLMSSK